MIILQNKDNFKVKFHQIMKKRPPSLLYEHGGYLARNIGRLFLYKSQLQHISL